MWSVVVWLLVLSLSFSLGTCRKREPSYEIPLSVLSTSEALTAR
jgi:hypothetical protein